MCGVRCAIEERQNGKKLCIYDENINHNNSRGSETQPYDYPFRNFAGHNNDKKRNNSNNNNKGMTNERPAGCC